MCAIRILVLPNGAFLDVETREAEHLLTKDAEVLVINLRHEQLLCETRIARVLSRVLDIVHALDEIFFCDAKRLTEVKRVKMATLLVHDHHDIVGRLIVHQQLSVAISNDATARILNLLEESIGIGAFAVVVTHELEREQTDDVDRNNEYGHATYDNLPMLYVKIIHANVLPFLSASG